MQDGSPAVGWEGAGSLGRSSRHCFGTDTVWDVVPAVIEVYTRRGATFRLKAMSAHTVPLALQPYWLYLTLSVQCSRTLSAQVPVHEDSFPFWLFLFHFLHLFPTHPHRNFK